MTLKVTPYSSAETKRLLRLINKTGTSLTRLAPGGLVLIDGERLHAESEGMLIPADAAVKVLAMKGNRLLVRQLRFNPADDQPQDSLLIEEHERTPLDDDLSQS